MQQLNEEGSGEPHDHQTDEASGKDDEELPTVQTADVADTAWRKCDRKSNCSQN
ncbi:hypothetical protein D3C73_1331590 [compost metagenome]